MYERMKKMALTVMAVTCIYIGTPMEAAADYVSFDEMYSSASAYGYTFSDKMQGLEGQEITMQGFMAPPLKPSIQFFVLTAMPMSVCPFCSTDADWPDDIIVVEVDTPVTALPFDSPIEVTGTLSLGSKIDDSTGFVSQARIEATSIRAL